MLLPVVISFFFLLTVGAGAVMLPSSSTTWKAVTVLHMSEGGGTTTKNEVNGEPYTLSAQVAWVTGKLSWGTDLTAANGTQIL